MLHLQIKFGCNWTSTIYVHTPRRNLRSQYPLIAFQARRIKMRDLEAHSWQVLVF